MSTAKNELGRKEGKMNIKIRPYCQEFLDTLHKFYNIVVFTAASWDYAKQVTDQIDPTKKYFKTVFHRDHCLITKDHKFIKDLRIVSNYDTRNCLIIDNRVISFAMQPGNGILIYPYEGDPKDDQLKEMLPFLIWLSDSFDLVSELKQSYNLKNLVKNDLIKLKGMK
jgi:Dullard-like phosphatase family protein